MFIERRFRTRLHQGLWAVACTGFLICILVLVAAGCFARKLSHDENVFVASGALLSRGGLWPYVDYPYFHLPNLVFIFAALFRTNDFLLLTARSFNVICAWLLLWLVFAVAASQFRFLKRQRWIVAGCFVAILALDPRFRYAVGRAWNHDLPVLTSVAAFLTLLGATDSQGRDLFARVGAGSTSFRSPRSFMLSGALLGLAIGTRATFAPLLVPFIALTYILPVREERRSTNILWLITGIAISLIPTGVLFGLGPSRFLYDNLTYNGALNFQWERTNDPGNTALLRKLSYAFHQFKSSPGLLLLGGFAYFCVLQPCFERKRMARENLAVLFLLPFLWLGASIPMASHPQYYYMVVPFLLLGIIFGMARVWNNTRSMPLITGALVIALTIGITKLIADIRGIHGWTKPRDWPVFAVHRLGQRVGQIAAGGPVLTLAPIYPLEGGAIIYKELATGPFAWRTAPFVSQDRKQRFDFIDADDIEAFLQPHPPTAVLTGFEAEQLEAPLKHYAERNGFTKLNLAGGKELWVSSKLLSRGFEQRSSKH